MSRQSPAIHSVHIYDRDTEMISRLCGIVSGSLRVGDAALIVATPEHRELLVGELEDTGIDVRNSVREGRYVMLDSAATLASILRKGWPDRRLFDDSVGQMLHTTRARARSRNQGVVVFGEMVALLWAEGKKDAALELEAIWNTALNANTFHLHCAYPRAVFANDMDVSAVCETHTHAVLSREMAA